MSRRRVMWNGASPSPALDARYRRKPRFAQTHGRPSRWPLMTEDGKTLETLLEDAARARRLAIAIDGDPAALELEQYAEEVEAEIHRRAAGEDIKGTRRAR
jgi:hypothetical protein